MLDIFLDASPSLILDTLLLLVVLVALEGVLSADNAIALASLAQGLEDTRLEQRALTVGLVFAFMLRVGLILGAGWVNRFWQFQVMGSAYLLWLSLRYFTAKNQPAAPVHGPRFASLWQAIPLIAVTDLAFSLDSVTTALAVSQETWLVIVGGLIGVIALRFLAGLFVRWLEEFSHLQDAGYCTVTLVGLRLMLRVVAPGLVPPEWAMFLLMGIFFAWGFSQRQAQAMGTREPEADATLLTRAPDTDPSSPVLPVETTD